MASPPVLFSSAAFFARPLSWTFQLAAECGYQGVEVMVTKDPESQDPARIRALAEEFGLTVGALHAPCLLLTRKVWGTDPIGKIDRSVEAAADAGIPVVVVHPPYRWQRAFRRWLIDDLPEPRGANRRRRGRREHVPGPIGGQGRDVPFEPGPRALEGLPHLVLDTSHAAVAKHDPIAVRKLFGERLRHVHLSDNAGKGWDSHLPPGEGVLDLDGFLEDLAASGFDGAVSLEVDLRPSLGDARRARGHDDRHAGTHRAGARVGGTTLA